MKNCSFPLLEHSGAAPDPLLDEFDAAGGVEGFEALTFDENIKYVVGAVTCSGEDALAFGGAVYGALIALSRLFLFF